MRAALIGGTGFGDLLADKGAVSVNKLTPYGAFEALQRSDGILIVARHGKGHRLPPHKVPYKAIAYALRELEIEVCISTAAVGSLAPQLTPGTIAAVTDFIDFTGRNITMFEDEVVHTDFTPGMSERVVERLQATEVRQKVVYACTNGPRYETPAEVRALRLLGADVVGMTVATEATVLKEVGIEYGCLATVTNYAAGVHGSKELNHEEVTAVSKAAANRVVAHLLSAVR